MREEGFVSGSRFYLERQIEALASTVGLTWPAWLPGAAFPVSLRYLGAIALILGALALRHVRDASLDIQVDGSRALTLLLTALVLTTPTYPWCGLLSAALLPLARGLILLPALVVTGAALVLYLQWWWPGQPTWPIDVVYGGGAGALAAAAAVGAIRMLSWSWPRVWRPAGNSAGNERG